MSTRKVRSDESLDTAMREARGSTFVQDTYSTPGGHRDMNEALRRVREETTFSACPVCSRATRQDIDDELTVGMSSEQIASSYELDAEDIQRHRKYHLPALEGASEGEEGVTADRLINQELAAFGRERVQRGEHRIEDRE